MAVPRVCPGGKGTVAMARLKVALGSCNQPRGAAVCSCCVVSCLLQGLLLLLPGVGSLAKGAAQVAPGSDGVVGAGMGLL